MRHLYDWFGLNVALFHLINGLHAAWWDDLMLAMTWLGDHARFPYYMAIVLLIPTIRRQWMPHRNIATFGVGYVLTAATVTVLKPRLNFPRPLLVLGKSVVVVGQPEFHHSLPSGHAAFAVLLAASLSRGIAKPVRWALWLFALLVCISRVAVGAHFPADVLGGVLIGLTVVAIVSGVIRILSLLGGGRADHTRQLH